MTPPPLPHRAQQTRLPDEAPPPLPHRAQHARLPDDAPPPLPHRAQQARLHAVHTMRQAPKINESCKLCSTRAFAIITSSERCGMWAADQRLS